MPRKTITQIRQEIHFQEVVPDPCCANCKHENAWMGCRNPQHPMALQKSHRITICADHRPQRGKH